MKESPVEGEFTSQDSDFAEAHNLSLNKSKGRAPQASCLLRQALCSIPHSRREAHRATERQPRAQVAENEIKRAVFRRGSA